MPPAEDVIFDEVLDRRLRGAAVDVAALLAAHPELDADQRARLQRLCGALDVTEGAPALPEHVGPYRVLRELGHGGQGVVYLAQDARFARTVALKVLDRGSSRLTVPRSGARDPVARLRREAETAARLNHPGICVIHELGSEGDRAYIAMRHVDGETLAQRIARARAGTARLPDRSGVLELVAIIESAARALHVAHEAGIVHRDIKPGNIMVTPQGQPVILDFGLAQDDDSDAAGLTLTGEVFGTPAYMSPEQLSPAAGRPDRRTDVYSLGVALFEALTLRRPFEAATREQLHELIRAGILPDPRRANAAIRRDLGVVLATALERDRDRRYQTALDLAEDLRRVREREPIRARPAGRLLRFGRWTQRNPVLATATLGLILALTTVLVVVLVMLHRERGALLLSGARAALAADPGLALALAIEGAQRAPGLDANDTLVAVLDALHERRALMVEPRGIRSGAVDPAGRWVVTGATDGRLRAWRPADGAPLAELPGHAAELLCTVASLDGSRVATCSSDGKVRVWDTATWQCTRELAWPPRPWLQALFVLALDVHGRRLAVASTAETTALLWDLESAAPPELLDTGGLVAAMAFRPDDAELFTLGTPCVQRFWDLSGLQPRVRREVLGTRSDPPRISAGSPYSPDGALVSVINLDGGFSLLDVATGAERRRIEAPGGAANLMRLGPDGRRFAGAAGNGLIIADVGGDRAPRLVGDHDAGVLDTCFSPDGSLVLSDAGDGRACVWDAVTGKLRCVLAAEVGGMQAVRFDEDGSGLMAACADGTLRWWSVRSGAEERSLHFGSDTLLDVAIDREGRQIAATLSGGRALVLDKRSGAVLRELRVSTVTTRLQTVAFSPDGRHLLTAAREDGVRVWDIASGAPLLTLPHVASEWEAAFSPDGSRLVTAGEDDVARIWDARTGGLLRELHGHTQGVRSVGVSADGRRIATASEHALEHTLRVWDGETGAEVAVLRDGDSRPIIARLDADGSRVIVASTDAIGRVWDVARREVVLRLLGHTDLLSDATFSPDGTLIATSSEDRTVRLWDAATGAELATLSSGRHIAPKAVTFTPDGGSVVTAWTDGVVRLWPVNPLQAALARRPRELTAAERQRYRL